MKAARKQTPSGFSITDRDVEIVRYLGRVKLATVDEVRLRFGLARSKAYARLSGLVGRGLLRHESDVPGPGVYLATASGLALAGLDLAPADMSLGALRHDLAAARFVARIEREMPNQLVLTEREIRQHVNLTGDLSYRPKVQRRGVRGARHWPDIAIPTNSGDKQLWAAVEIELSQKAAERTRAILAGYRKARLDTPPQTLWGVLYVVPGAAHRERIARVAAQEDLGAESWPVVFAASALDSAESPATAFRRLLASNRAAAAAARAQAASRRQRERGIEADRAAMAAQHAELRARRDQEREQATTQNIAQEGRRSAGLFGRSRTRP